MISSILTLGKKTVNAVVDYINKTKLIGNTTTQKALEYGLRYLLFLMGVGAGAGVETSGENLLVERLGRLEKNNYNVFDVGANKGDFTHLVLSSWHREEPLQVHCFEPADASFQHLTNELGSKSNVNLNKVGLGREKGTSNLYYPSEGSGLASLTKRRLDHFDIEFDKSEEISIDTIDNYCHRKDIQQIDLLKIDVEGHELDVLAGAKEMLSKDAIKMISFEFGGCNIDTRTYFQDYYYFFSDQDMEIYRITPSGYLHQITRYKEEYEQFRTTNYLATRQEVDS